MANACDPLRSWPYPIRQEVAYCLDKSIPPIILDRGFHTIIRANQSCTQAADLTKEPRVSTVPANTKYKTKIGEDGCNLASSSDHILNQISN